MFGPTKWKKWRMKTSRNEVIRLILPGQFHQRTSEIREGYQQLTKMWGASLIKWRAVALAMFHWHSVSTFTVNRKRERCWTAAIFTQHKTRFCPHVKRTEHAFWGLERKTVDEVRRIESCLTVSEGRTCTLLQLQAMTSFLVSTNTYFSHHDNDRKTECHLTPNAPQRIPSTDAHTSISNAHSNF
jgi:hypothetical protein